MLTNGELGAWRADFSESQALRSNHGVNLRTLNDFASAIGPSIQRFKSEIVEPSL